ncbi:hypothetical protein [Streptomyces sp. JHA26]|uniref:hypothetical protein n=1 Tax=Streptomyces sp. JHA26 TaxID=1917143 RepID=UPI0027D8AB26|nr:hypothetical protein [Streptomyces sp. JHA26]
MTLVTAESTASTANATSTADAARTAVRADRPGGAHVHARRSVRAAAAAVALVGALTLTACTDGGDSEDAPGKGGASSATPGAPSSADTGGTGGDSPSAAADGLEGSWLTTSDGHVVALMVTGGKAALFATGGSMCSGTAGEESGTRTIRLKCTDGTDDRASGTVESVDGTSLRVRWRGALGEETYTRSEGGSLPPGLPTAGPSS